ncbi:MAG: hypothetical protein ABIS69_01570 [Sediminibacterium sp.]
MIQAMVINTGARGVKHSYLSTPDIEFTHIYIAKDFDVNLDGYDLLFLPNGSDHLALYTIRHRISDFLAKGGMLFNFSGWFMNYIPGSQWVMSTDIKSIDVRYYANTDRYGLLKDVAIDQLIYRNGISGWWACGYIETNPNADIVLKDTLGRGIIILDEHTTNGTIVCVSGGPVTDKKFGDDTGGQMHPVNQLFANFLQFAISKKQYQLV